MKKIREFISEMFSVLAKPEMRILPGNIAFFLVLSIIPIITLFGVIASMFSISVDTLVLFLTDALPNEIVEVLVPFISGRGFDIPLFIFMLIGFFFASNGPHSIIIASNTLYKFDEKNELSRRIKAIFMTVILVNLIIFLVVFLGFSNNILEYFLEFEFLKKMSSQVYLLFNLIKWPVSFFFIFFLIKVIYTIAPDRNIKSKYMNKGSLFTTVLIIILTLGYSIYTSKIANYDIFYGSLSNIIILMIWIYLISIVLVMGIILNTYTYEEIQKKRQAIAEKKNFDD